MEKQDPLEVIREYLRISEDIVTSGQPTPEQFKLIREAGFDVVINLATSQSPDALVNEGDLVRENGMAYVHIPVIWEKPTRDDLNKFFSMFEQHSLYRMFVHCARNMRVSAFIFLYRVLSLGEDSNLCLADMEKVWRPDAVWQAFIDQMLKEFEVRPNIRHWKIDWSGYTAFQSSIPD